MEDKEKVQEGDMLQRDDPKAVATGLVGTIIGILIVVGIIILLLRCLAPADYTPYGSLP